MKELSKNRIIVDTNVLLQYFNLILNHRTKERFFLLNQFTNLFKGKQLIIVPQVLAEIYSLLKRDANNPEQLRQWLRDLKNPHLENIKEHYVPKKEILDEKNFLDFGFTDIALMKILNKNNCIITNDNPFAQFCKKKGLDVHYLEEYFDRVDYRKF